MHTLSASEGNILDDPAAIEVLGNAKRISDDVSAKQAIAEKTTEKLDATRESYKSAAFRSSILFFSIAAMANIDPMYQFSLAWYVLLFERAIDDAEQSTDLPVRLKNLIAQNTISVYRNVCRSLYEKDNALLFLACTNILRGDDKLDLDQFSFFLTGGTGLIDDSAPKNPTGGVTSDGSPWLAQARWERSCACPRSQLKPAKVAQHPTSGSRCTSRRRRTGPPSLASGTPTSTRMESLSSACASCAASGRIASCRW